MSISKNVTSKSAVFSGLLKAKASERNPLQTIVELVITPFGPNKNGQAIPKTEAENIKRTALYAPVKIDLEDQTLGGHKDSIPVGPIISVAEIEDSIIGEGVIWDEEFPQVTEYLKKRTAENNPPGTSWEILYEDSYIENGIEYLTGTYYAANTIVANPSYGEKTLIRCVAEDLGADMAKVTAEHAGKEKPVDTLEENASLDEERSQLMMLQNDVASMWQLLDEMYWKTFEIEEAERVQNPTASVEGFVSRFEEIMTSLNSRANDAGVALAETQTNLETLQGKLTDLQAELDELKEEKAKAELDKKLAERKTLLSEAGVEVDEIEKLIALDDTAFELFVSTVKQVKSKSTAESKVKINLPDPVSNGEVDNSVVIESHNSLYKRGK